VAIVTNGTAILGLGDIGPVAGMPVMEGKAVLFDALVGINGVPILLASKDTEEIIRTVAIIAPTFGAIKLEDSRRRSASKSSDASTRCWTSRSCTMTSTVPQPWPWPLCSMPRNTWANPFATTASGWWGWAPLASALQNCSSPTVPSAWWAPTSNPGAMEIFAKAGGTPMSLDEVMRTADIVIGVTGAAGLLKTRMIRKGQIILAMSNPRPEISPEDARKAGAAFAADGRSVNNGLAFPGIFRGALNARARSICNRMKIAAARTIASFAATGELVPSMLNLDMHKAVAQAVERAAFEAGVARARSADLPE